MLVSISTGKMSGTSSTAEYSDYCLSQSKNEENEIEIITYNIDEIDTNDKTKKEIVDIITSKIESKNIKRYRDDLNTDFRFLFTVPSEVSKAITRQEMIANVIEFINTNKDFKNMKGYLFCDSNVNIHVHGLFSVDDRKGNRISFKPHQITNLPSSYSEYIEKLYPTQIKEYKDKIRNHEEKNENTYFLAKQKREKVVKKLDEKIDKEDNLKIDFENISLKNALSVVRHISELTNARELKVEEKELVNKAIANSQKNVTPVVRQLLTKLDKIQKVIDERVELQKMKMDKDKRTAEIKELKSERMKLSNKRAMKTFEERIEEFDSKFDIEIFNEDNFIEQEIIRGDEIEQRNSGTKRIEEQY